MTTATPDRPSRLLFLGEDSLCDGFRLIGFETLSNPSDQEVETLLAHLIREREQAFVIVDQRLMQANIPSLRHIRREGGRILLIAVPPLRTPDDLASEVAERVRTLFGNSTAIKGRQP